MEEGPALVENITPEVLAELFAKASDQDTVNEVEEIITKLRRSGPSYVEMCLVIAQNGDQVQQRYSFVEVNRSLTPYSPDELRGMRETFENPEFHPLRDQLKEFGYNLIYTDDDFARNQGSALLANLFGIDPLNTIDVISQLIDEIMEIQDQSSSICISVLAIMREILTLVYNGELKDIGDAKELYEKFISAAIYIITDWNNTEDNLLTKCRALNLLSRYIITWPDFFDQEIIVEQLINICQLMLELANEVVFSPSLDMLFSIIKTFYNKIRTPFVRIFEITFQFIQPGTADQVNPKILNETFEFFRQIAEFEFEILKTPPVFQRNPITCQNIFNDNGYYVSLFEAIHAALVNLDPTDQGIEDTSVKTPSMFAAVTLNYLFKATGTHELFELITSNFVQDSADGAEWNQCHAACMLMYGLASKEAHFARIVEKEISSFVSANLPTLIRLCQHDVIRVRESAMYVLAQIINRYPQSISDIPESQRAVQEILAMYTQIEGYEAPLYPIDSETADIIVLRAVLVINAVCKAFKPTQYNNPLEGEFFRIIEFCNHVIQLEQVQERSQQIITHAFECMNQLFIHAPRRRENMRQILDVTMERLSDPDVMQNFYIAAGLCSNVSTLVSRINEPTAELLESRINALFNLLETPQVSVYEEALIAIATMIIRIEHDVNPEIIGGIIRFIKQGLDSLNPQVIRSSCILISDLFLKLRGQMASEFDDLITNIFDMLNSDDVLMPAKPSLIRAAADMFLGLDCDDYGEELDKKAPYFYGFLQQYRDYPFDPEDRNQAEVGDEMLGCVAYGFMAYEKRYFLGRDMEIPEEKAMLLEVAKVSDRIYKHSKVTVRTLRNALNMFVVHCERCSRRNNVVLNRGINYKVIDMAMTFSELRDEAKEAKKRLGNT